MNIHELTRHQKELENILFFEEDNEIVQQKLAEINGTIEERILYFSKMLAELMLQEAAFELAYKKQKERYEAAKRATQRQREFIEGIMRDSGTGNIKNEYITLGFRANNVGHLRGHSDDLEERFTKEVTKMVEDKVAIRAAIDNGEEVPGYFVSYEPTFFVKL